MALLNLLLSVISLLVFWIAGYDRSEYAMEFSLTKRIWNINKFQCFALVPLVLQALMVMYGK